MKKLGFTLAEVLITLTIIGVIATMVLPSLQTNVTTRTIETGMQKFYSTFHQGMKSYMSEQNLDSLYLGYKYGQFITSTFNVETQCEKRTDCFAKEYKTILGEKYAGQAPNVTSTNPAYVLQDGTIIFINSLQTVYIDINGKKGPNVLNKDYWVLDLTIKGKLRDISLSAQDPDYEPLTPEATFINYCKKGKREGCFTHFVRNGFKFDY